MNKNYLDYQYTLLYGIFYSLASVLIASISHLPVQLSLFITTFIAIVFFNIINYKNLKHIYLTCFSHIWLFLLINAIVFIMWIFAYLGIQLSNANLFNFIFFMSLGFSGSVFDKNYVKAGLVLIVLLLAIYMNIHLWEGAMYGLIGGASGYAYNYVSHRFSKATKLSPSQVLASRFYVMLFILIPFLSSNSIALLNWNNIGVLVVISITSFILPLYLSQKGLSKIGVQAHSFLLSFTPLFTYLIEGLLLHQWPFIMLIFSLLVPIVLNLHLFKKHASTKQSQE